MKKGFDLDGTIYDLISPLDNWAKSNNVKKINKIHFDLEKRYGLKGETSLELLGRFQKSGGYKNLIPYKDAKEVVSRLMKRGENYFITHRGFNGEVKKETYEQIKHDFPTVNLEKQVIISPEKGKWAKDLSLDLVFEDYLKNAEDIIEKSSAHVILFNQDYNQGPTPERTIRVNNWGELIPFSEMCSNLAKHSFPRKITIAGFPGAGKTNAGGIISKLLGYEFVSIGKLRRDFARNKYNVTIQELNKLRETSPEVDTEFDDFQKEYGRKNNNFLVEGRLGYYFIPDSLKIFFSVDKTKGAERILKQKRKDEISVKSLEEQIKTNDERIESDILTYKKQYNQNCYNKNNFDVVLNTTNLTEMETIVRLLKIIENY